MALLRPTGHKIPMFLFAIIMSYRVSSFLSSVVNKQNADTQKKQNTLNFPSILSLLLIYVS